MIDSVQVIFDKRTIVLYVFAFVFALPTYAQIQNSPKGKNDTLVVKGDHFLFLDNNVFYIPRDTVIYVNNNVDVLIKKHSLEKTQEFYERVETKMSTSRLSGWVYDFIFTSPHKSNPHTEDFSELRFSMFQGKTVSHVGYKKLASFGTRMNDTTYYNPSKYTNLLNKTHVNTLGWVLNKNLLFKKGTPIEPSDFVNTERLLRRLEYIQDARIMVKSYPGEQTADIIVVTKDVFPYNIEVNPGNDNNSLFGVSHINLWGTGHELEYNYIKPDQYEFYYSIRNILGTFIDSQIDYANHFRKTGLGVTLRKDFVTQETKIGGGAEYSQFEFGEFSYNPSSDITSEFFYTRLRRDIWVGRAFKTTVQSRFLGFEDETYAVASARIDYQDFFDRPTVSIDTNYRYHDRTSLLFSLGLSSREYYKDKFILNYGRMEDIPTGTTISLVTGLQQREFEDRVYIGANYARGGYISGFGYLNHILSIGSFIGEQGFTDGVLKIGADYFSGLIPLGQFKFRQFANLSFAQTIDPTEDLYLTTQNDLGIRGVSGYFLKSTSKLNLKVEPLLYTPVTFLGFRLAVFGFFDVTLTSNHKSEFFKAETFSGYGMGLRFRNDNLAISTLQFRFGFYPNLPINAQSAIVDISTSSRLHIRDFDFKAPEIVPFR